MLFDRENICELSCLLQDAESHLYQVIQTSPSLRFQKFNDKISDSGYRSIFRGYDKDSGCEIAWNVIPLNHVSGSERKLLVRRINQFKSFNHPNFIKCISWWVSKSRLELVYVTEMVSGSSLWAHLAKIKPPKLKIIKNWCLQLLDALCYYHSQPNLPPAFLYLRCSKIMINCVTNQLKIASDAFVTHSIEFCRRAYFGSPQFLPPQISSDDVGMHTDVYCFGMTLIEMLTLRRPYSGYNPAQVYARVREGVGPGELEEIGDGELKGVILGCLGEPKTRPSVQQLYKMQYWRVKKQNDNIRVVLNQPCTKSKETSLMSEVSQPSELQHKTFLSPDNKIVTFTLQSPHIGLKSFKLHSQKLPCFQQLFHETAQFIQRRLHIQKMKSQGGVPFEQILKMSEQQKTTRLINETFSRMYSVYELSIKELTARYSIKTAELLAMRLKREKVLLEKMQEGIRRELENIISKPISYAFGKMNEFAYTKHKSIVIDTCKSISKIDETLSLKKKISSITLGNSSHNLEPNCSSSVLSNSCSQTLLKDSEPPTPRKEFNKSQNAILTIKNTARKNSIQVNSLTLANINEVKFSKNLEKNVSEPGEVNHFTGISNF